MTKIEAGANNTIIVTDIETNTYFIILGSDCELRVYDDINIYNVLGVKKRTVTLFNKYNRHIVAQVTTNTLSTDSTGYDANMDIYAQNLLSILF